MRAGRGVDLRPTILDDFGLPDALRFLAEGVAGRSGILVHVEADLGRRLPPTVELGLYRIVQEALNNVVKHAHARQVEITLRAVGGSTYLAVRDDGQGFALEPARAADGLRSRALAGFGLRIMRERAEARGGRIDVISAPGQGTIVEVRLPQEDERP